jgi:hypothetical protein
MTELLLSRYLKTLLGLLICHFLGAIIVEAVFWVSDSDLEVFSSAILFNKSREAFALWLGTLLFAIPCGVLVHGFLYRRNWLTFWQYTIGGFSGSIGLRFLFWLFAGFPTIDVMDQFTMALIGWACCDAMIFWLIRRPDKDVKQETPPPTR